MRFIFWLNDYKGGDAKYLRQNTEIRGDKKDGKAAIHSMATTFYQFFAVNKRIF
jgi:hypothetical protein